jgi:hypothetical protein
MKKLSLLIICLFSAFVFLSNAAVSQTEHITAEDSTVDHAEKVYESADVQSLKGTPRVYTDGYNTYINDRVKFQISDIDNIMQDSVFYRLDNGEDVKYTGPFSITEEGSHLVEYYSVDKMGNREAVKNITVIVDNTAPEVVVTITAPFAKTNDKIWASEKFNYEYSISAKDNLSGVAGIAYSEGTSEYREYMKPFIINSSTPVRIAVNAEDKVGNLTKNYTTRILDENGVLVAESVDDIAIAVDRTAPTVEIKADREFYVKDNVKVASKDYKYTITATDQESGVKAIYYRIDSKSEFILYTDEIQFNSNGMHKIEAIAKDNVGNVSNTAVLDVFVDIIPAESSIKFVTE